MSEPGGTGNQVSEEQAAISYDRYKSLVDQTNGPRFDRSGQNERPHPGIRIASADEVQQVYDSLSPQEKEQKIKYELKTQISQIIPQVYAKIDRMLPAQDVRPEERSIQTVLREGLIRTAWGEETKPIDLIGVKRTLEWFLEKPDTIAGFEEGVILLEPYFFQAQDIGRDQVDVPELTSDRLAPEVRRVFDAMGEQLRIYEGNTTDTTRTLEELIPIIQHDELMIACGSDKDRLTILDMGAGEGRLAMALALLGHTVNGIDISSAMVEAAENRLNGLLNQEPGGADSLIADTTKAFDRLGLNVPMTPEAIDAARNRVSIKQGDFFSLGHEKYDQMFTAAPATNETAEDDEENKADVVMFMWHTFNFAGNRDGQRLALQNAYDNLNPGGKLIIEIPDPSFGEYRRALEQFHNLNPNMPLGMIVDAPSANSGEASVASDNGTARYFPTFSELAGDPMREKEGIAEEVGFSFSDLKTYFVRQQTEAGQILAIKESLFVFTKPISPKQYERIKNWVESSRSDQS